MPVNPVATAAVTNAAAPGANPAAAAAGPQGSFEALMAALFGAAAVTTPTVGAATAPTASTGLTDDADATDGDAADASAATPDASAQTLMAALAGAAPAAVVVDTPDAGAVATGTGAPVVSGPPADAALPAAAAAPGEKAAIFKPDFPGQGKGLEVARQAVAGATPRVEPHPEAPTAPQATDAPPDAATAAAAPAQQAVGPPAQAQASIVAHSAPPRTAPTTTPSSTDGAPEAGDAEPGAEGAAAGGGKANAHAAKAGQPAQTASPKAFEATKTVVPETARQDAAPEPAPLAAGADTTTAGPTTGAHAAASHVASLRGAPETVATLAAQILKKLDSRTTRFDVELDPAGLGRVDVRLEIGAQGRLTAAMSFDNPHSAQELRNRSAELSRALEQAGFDVTDGLSFDVADQSGGSGQNNTPQDQAGDAPWRGRAFQAALDTAAGADTLPKLALSLARSRALGVDIRI